MARKVIHRRRNPRGKPSLPVLMMYGGAGVFAWQQGLLSAVGIAKPAEPWFGLGKPKAVPAPPKTLS